MSKATATLYSLAGRITYADGVYTMSAPGGFRFAQPLVDFQSTGITDSATDTVLALSDTVIAAEVPIKPKGYATASRPSASAAGEGAEIYDTDLNKPLWSNGTAWRDATGADPDA